MKKAVNQQGHGEFIEEPEIHKELDLKGTACSDYTERAKYTLGEIAHGQVLKVVVEHEQNVHELEKTMIHKGHRVLEVKRINKTDWEMLIQKQNNLYTI